MPADAPGAKRAEAPGAGGDADRHPQPDHIAHEADLEGRIALGQPLHRGIEDDDQEGGRQHVDDGPGGEIAQTRASRLQRHATPLMESPS